MRAKQVILPGESEEDYQQRQEKWMAEFDPSSDRERYLVERVVVASWRMDRGVAAEQAMGIRNRNAVIEGEENRQARTVAKLTARLEKDPSLIREIRRIPAGARWVREQYVILQRHLESNSCLLSSQRYLAIQLLGKRISDVFRGDPLVTQWLVAMLGASYGADGMDDDQVDKLFRKHRIEHMSDIEFDDRIDTLLDMLPEKKAGKAALQACIAAAIAALDEHIELLDALAERDLEQALQDARVDRTVDGQRLLKYEKQHEGSCFAMVKGIEKFQNPPRPRPGGGGGPGSGRGRRNTETPIGAAVANPGPGDEEETAAPADCPCAPAAPGASRAAVAQVEPALDPSPNPNPNPDVGASANEPISADPTIPAAERIAASPTPDRPQLAPPTAPGAAEVPGEKTTEDIPVPEPTEEEAAQYARELAALEELRLKLEHIYGRRADSGEARADRPPPPDPSASAIKAILDRTPSSVPTPDQAVRAPPDGT
jgi:hypothetical protein